MRSRRGTPIAALRFCLAAIALTAGSSAASAAECEETQGLTGCVDADNLWMSAGATPFFSLGPGLTTPAGKLSFGLGLTYLSRPVGIVVSSAGDEGTNVWAVDNALNATFLFALGVTDRLQLTAAAPVTLFQDGAGLYSVLGSDAALPRAGVRDVRFGLDYAFLAPPRTGSGDGLSLLGRFQFALPTGEKDALSGSRTVTWVPSVLGEYRIGRATFGAEVGARVRGASTLAQAKVGTQVQASLGASVAILPKLLIGNAEAFALVGVDEQPAGSSGGPPVPAEWMVSVSTAPFLGGDVSGSFGAGGPIPFSDPTPVTTPRIRLSLAIRYAPTGQDSDGDGVLDRDDQCPGAIEDRDGFQDGDGCPDPDNDGDRIPDDRDRCRDDAETVDGYKDDDGCPDLDDDGDNIPDEVDQCRNEPEDYDGFQDDDGCPDDDNDGDGILDKKDLCPTGAEDKDGFRDTDGCPDPDNDLDNIPDAEDACPDEAEDKDGFMDTDGCPDPDNDGDGILDGVDACSTAAETIDGNADGDGCPEPGARSLVKWSGNQVTLDTPAAFPRGSAKPSADLEKKLAMVAQLVRGASPVSVIIEAYADRQGDTSAKAADLADKRALAVKAALVAAGIPAEIVTAASGDPSAKRAPGAPSFDVTVRRPKPKTPKKPAPTGDALK
ncbi:MAG: OmpA family protein [Polyangiaceae bacterium]